MDMTSLAKEIEHKVVADTAFWVACIGLAGVVIGSALTIIGNILHHWLETRPLKRIDDARKKLLKRMLEDSRFPNRWRRLSTLSRVIGADEDATKRLLIEVNARGSEKDDSLWGLIELHPFDEIDQ